MRTKVIKQQGEILEAYSKKGFSNAVKRKQQKLVESLEGRVVAVYSVCSSPGGKTPGVDGQI